MSGEYINVLGSKFYFKDSNGFEHEIKSSCFIDMGIRSYSINKFFNSKNIYSLAIYNHSSDALIVFKNTKEYLIQILEKEIIKDYEDYEDVNNIWNDNDLKKIHSVFDLKKIKTLIQIKDIIE